MCEKYYNQSNCYTGFIVLCTPRVSIVSMVGNQNSRKIFLSSETKLTASNILKALIKNALYLISELWTGSIIFRLVDSLTKGRQHFSVLHAGITGGLTLGSWD